MELNFNAIYRPLKARKVQDVASSVAAHFGYDFAISLWNTQRFHFVACAPRWPTCDCGARNREAVTLRPGIMTSKRKFGLV